ncbi:uncharacterized protein V1516DRAFT_49071 [Lipomyces oligophaga]|uniref:uncharacterized protein n=1 Tax=Lipomyces oligophaga TaxID=45792 RepID=UPI0034CD3A93
MATTYGGYGGYGGYGNAGYENNGTDGGYYNNGGEPGGNFDGKSDSQGRGDRQIPDGKTRLRPVIIRQILEATKLHDDANFTIDNVEVVSVTFVGIIRTVSHRSTNSTYRIDDGTGMCDVRKMIKQDEEEAGNDNGNKEHDLQVGDYVRVIGDLNDYNDRRYVLQRNMRVVTGVDEVIYSVLEPLALHFSKDLSNASSISNGNNASHSMMDIDDGQYTALQKKVIQCAQSFPEIESNEGVHLSKVASKLQLSEQVVRDTVEALCSMGAAYDTINELHFKLT